MTTAVPLKVTNVERIVVDVPFTPRQTRITERTVYNWSIFELCKVTTDAGLVGWGETGIHYTWARVTDAAVHRVLGRSPAELMNEDALGAGLQMALFDVVGKALGVPCYQVMGTKVRDWVPISWWSNEASPEDWAEEAKEAVENGYTSFKIKQRPWRDIVAQVEAIKAIVPSHFTLDIDANGTMHNAAAAMPIMQRLAQYEMIAMFESPISLCEITVIDVQMMIETGRAGSLPHPLPQNWGRGAGVGARSPHLVLKNYSPGIRWGSFPLPSQGRG